MSNTKQVTDNVASEAVDYRSGAPWDFGLVPEALRRVAACTRQRVAQAQHWPAPQPA